MTLVREFNLRFDVPAPVTPPLRPDPDQIRLRARLIREESKEVMVELEALAAAVEPDEVVAIYRRLLKELCDLRYVTDGCAVVLALPIDAAFEAVHASNMTKSMMKDGGGKVQKGPGYVPPDMGRFVPDIVDHQEADIT